jgi:hypothetical protein
MAICKVCEKDVVKVIAEMRPHPNGGKRYTYRDDNGKPWYGCTCPRCHLNKNVMALDPPSNRDCRKCKKKLPRSRYFFHVTCAPKEFLETDDDMTYSIVGPGASYAGISEASAEEGGEE